MTQFIVERLRHESAWELTFLYIPGVRFDDVWSALAMIGFRTFAGEDSDESTEVLFNFSLFADLSERISTGVESDYALALEGEASLVVMPQVHLELTDHFMVQAGAGVRFLPDDSLPEAAARVIYSF